MFSVATRAIGESTHGSDLSESPGYQCLYNRTLKSSCSRWISSIISSLTSWTSAISPVELRVTTSHFSGVITNIYKSKFINVMNMNIEIFEFFNHKLCQCYQTIKGFRPKQLDNMVSQFSHFLWWNIIWIEQNTSWNGLE